MPWYFKTTGLLDEEIAAPQEKVISQNALNPVHHSRRTTQTHDHLFIQMKIVNSLPLLEARPFFEGLFDLWSKSRHLLWRHRLKGTNHPIAVKSFHLRCTEKVRMIHRNFLNLIRKVF
jgi:hypothetical protein